MIKNASTIIKILCLILISVAIFKVWPVGLEITYARILTGGTNIVLSIVKNETHIKVEKDQDKKLFRIYTKINGKNANFPQLFETLMTPGIIVISWQIFLFLVLCKKQALQSLMVNVGIYYSLQILFLISLTGFYNSEIAKFFYQLMKETFHIFVLALLIKDNLIYPVFSKAEKTGL